MTSDMLITQIAIQVAGVIATLAAVKTGLVDVQRRVDKVETKLDDLPKEYVPRTEVELAVSGIRDTAEKTHAIVAAFLTGGQAFHASAAPCDQPSEDRLALVHPELAARVHAAMAQLAAQGTFFRVAQGLRTYAEQDKLYAQGRTEPGHIVTHARGGYSNHNFGCAVDCYPFLSGSGGDLNWDATSSQFLAMVDALQHQGLVWGGEWHDMPDAPHFQLAGVAVTPTAEDRAAFAAGGIAAVWARIPSAAGTPDTETQVA